VHAHVMPRRQCPLCYEPHLDRGKPAHALLCTQLFVALCIAVDCHDRHNPLPSKKSGCESVQLPCMRPHDAEAFEEFGPCSGISRGVLDPDAAILTLRFSATLVYVGESCLQ
jgi:hypothetical protein